MEKDDGINSGWLQRCPPLFDGSSSSAEVCCCWRVSQGYRGQGHQASGKLHGDLSTSPRLLCHPGSRGYEWSILLLHPRHLPKADFVKVYCSFLGRRSFPWISGRLLGVVVTELSANLLGEGRLSLMQTTFGAGCISAKGKLRFCEDLLFPPFAKSNGGAAPSNGLIGGVRRLFATVQSLKPQ